MSVLAPLLPAPVPAATPVAAARARDGTSSGDRASAQGYSTDQYLPGSSHRFDHLAERVDPPLRLTRPGDAPEQAANTIADQLTRRSSPAMPTSAPSGGSDRTASPGGEPLPEQLRSDFEPRLGRSLRNVRIHRDAAAANASRSLAARAFTHGRDIYFNPGDYQPDTSSGRWLIAHEIGHTQQDAPGQVARYAANTPLPDAPAAATEARTPEEEFDPGAGLLATAAADAPPPADETATARAIAASFESEDPASVAARDEAENATGESLSGAEQESLPTGSGVESLESVPGPAANESPAEPEEPAFDLGAGMERLAQAAALARRDLARLAPGAHATIDRAADESRHALSQRVDITEDSIRLATSASLDAMALAARTAENQNTVALRSREAELRDEQQQGERRMRGLFDDHRDTINRVSGDYVRDCETLRTEQANRLRRRVDEQIEDVTQRGIARERSLHGTDRGNVQGMAAWGVADRIIRGLRNNRPEAIAAIEEICTEMATRFEDAGRQALDGFDRPLPDLIAAIGDMATEAQGILAEQTTHASGQLATFTESSQQRLRRRSEEALSAVGMVGQTGQRQLNEAEALAHRQINRAIAAVRTIVVERLTEAMDELARAENPEPREAEALVNEEVARAGEAVERATVEVRSATRAMAAGLRRARPAADRELSASERIFQEDAAGAVRNFNDDVLSYELEVDENFGSTLTTLRGAYTENENRVRTDLAASATDVEAQFAQGYEEAEGHVIQGVDEALANNDAAVAQLDAKMEEAVEKAGWDYDHEVLATLRDVGGAIAGLVVGILAALALIAVFIIAFKISVVLGVILVVAAVGAFIIAPMIVAWRQGRLTWGFVGDLLLNITGINDIIRAFRDPDLTPFERGFHFGFGATNLVFVVYSAGRTLRTFPRGLRALPRNLRTLPEAVGRLPRAVARLPRAVARDVGRIPLRSRVLAGQGGRFFRHVRAGDWTGAGRAGRAVFSPWGRGGAGGRSSRMREGELRPPEARPAEPDLTTTTSDLPPVRDLSLEPRRAEPVGGESSVGERGGIDSRVLETRGRDTPLPDSAASEARPAAESAGDPATVAESGISREAGSREIAPEAPARTDGSGEIPPDAKTGRLVDLNSRRTASDRAAVQRRLHNNRVLERASEPGPDLPEAQAQPVVRDATTGRPIEVEGRALESAAAEPGPGIEANDIVAIDRRGGGRGGSRSSGPSRPGSRSSGGGGGGRGGSRGEAPRPARPRSARERATEAWSRRRGNPRLDDVPPDIDAAVERAFEGMEPRGREPPLRTQRPPVTPRAILRRIRAAWAEAVAQNPRLRNADMTTIGREIHNHIAEINRRLAPDGWELHVEERLGSFEGIPEETLDMTVRDYISPDTPGGHGELAWLESELPRNVLASKIRHLQPDMVLRGPGNQTIVWDLAPRLDPSHLAKTILYNHLLEPTGLTVIWESFWSNSAR